MVTADVILWIVKKKNHFSHFYYLRFLGGFCFGHRYPMRAGWRHLGHNGMLFLTHSTLCHSSFTAFLSQSPASNCVPTYVYIGALCARGSCFDSAHRIIFQTALPPYLSITSTVVGILLSQSTSVIYKLPLITLENKNKTHKAFAIQIYVEAASELSTVRCLITWDNKMSYNLGW